MSLASKMVLGDDDAFAAFVAPCLALGVHGGRHWRRELDPMRLRAANVGPHGVVTMDADGGVHLHHETIAEIDRLPEPPVAGPCAVSADGTRTFDGRRYRDARFTEEPYIEYLEQWTFASFIQERELALAFQTSQPLSEHGSFGYPHHGIEILGVTADGSGLEVRSSEHEALDPSENIVVADVVWHPRGVLAWTGQIGWPFGSGVKGYVLAQPRPRIGDYSTLLPDSDTRAPCTHFEWPLSTPHALCMDQDGHRIAVANAEEILIFDVLARRLARTSHVATTVALSSRWLVFLDATTQRREVALESLAWVGFEE